MTDVYDRATECEQQQRELAMRSARAGLAAPGDWVHASAKWCRDPHCGARIPDERRRALPGVELCVDCQARAEQKGAVRWG